MIVVTALFTKSSGQPAGGLALAEIDLYLFRRAKATGAVSTVWSGVHPTEEVGGGLYTRAYAGEDTSTYDYYAYAVYTGAVALDSDYSLQAASVEKLLMAAGVTFTGPVLAGGNALTYRGDSYLSEDGRALEWSSTGWVDLSGATIAVIVNRVAKFVGMVVTPTGPAVVRLELSSVNSLAIPAGRHQFQIVATQPDKDEFTLVDATWISRARVEV